MSNGGRIGVLAATGLSALAFGAATTAAHIAPFPELNNARFRVTFSAGMTTNWTIPEYQSATDFCFFSTTSGSGHQEVTFPTRTNPYHVVDSGSGPIFLQPDVINAGGTKEVHISRTGDVLTTSESSGNACSPGSVPPPSHEDNSQCGSWNQEWTLDNVIFQGHWVRPGVQALPTPGEGHAACPFFGALGGKQQSDRLPGFPPTSPWVQERFDHALRTLGGNKVIIVNGSQTFHLTDAEQHFDSTATVHWTLRLKRLKGIFTGPPRKPR